MSGRQIHLAVVILSAAGWLIGIGAGIAGAQHPSGALKDVGITPRIGQQIPGDIVLRDASGRQVTLADCLGSKPIILTPVYYRCPMLCGLELNGLVRCLRAMDMTPGKEFDILTFSIDPKETPDLAARKQANYLADYGRSTGTSGWRFTTGDANAVSRLCEAVGFQAAYDEESDQFAHAAGIMVVTPDGTISRYFYGVEFAPRDLRMALVEASAGKLGTVSDHILLYCYAYDPTTGKYGLAIMNVVRAAGFMTVVALAVGVGRMLRRERRGLTEHSRHPLFVHATGTSQLPEGGAR